MLDDRRVAVLGVAVLRAAGEHDRAADARVVGLEPGALAALAQHAGDARVAARDDALDAPSTPRLERLTTDDHDAVAVQRRTDGLGRDVDVVVTGGGDEAEAARVQREHAFPGVAGRLALAAAGR